MKTIIKLIALILTFSLFSTTFADYEYENKPIAENGQATKGLRNKYLYNSGNMIWRIGEPQNSGRIDFNLENKDYPGFLYIFRTGKYNGENNGEILVANNNGDVLWYEYTDDTKSKLILKKYIHSSNSVKYIVSLKTNGFLGIQNPTIDENGNTSFNFIYDLKTDNCGGKRLNINVYNKKAKLIETRKYNSCDNFLNNSNVPNSN